jgi:hypothetical protein
MIFQLGAKLCTFLYKMDIKFPVSSIRASLSMGVKDYHKSIADVIRLLDDLSTRVRIPPVSLPSCYHVTLVKRRAVESWT